MESEVRQQDSTQGIMRRLQMERRKQVSENLYDIHSLESLTADEIKTILALDKLRREAMADAILIKSAISFSIGEERQELWNDRNNAEYITHSGVWQARYLHQSYDVECSTEGIFKAYKEDYFSKGGCTAAEYFRVFVAKLRKEQEAHDGQA